MYVCMSLYVPHICSYPLKPEKDILSPRNGIIGSCETPDVSSENQIQILCKKRKYSEQPRQLLNPHTWTHFFFQNLVYHFFCYFFFLISTSCYREDLKSFENLEKKCLYSDLIYSFLFLFLLF